MSRIGLVAMSLSVAAACACAQDASAPSSPTSQAAVLPSVVAGGEAPAFVGKFIQGDPVAAYEPGKVYVVEFWATWCLPCKAAIPHLNELHNQYKDKGVVFIGQSVWETDAEAPLGFVKQMGDAMAYRIAVDPQGEGEDARGIMGRTWLKAAGINGIPSTWIVRNGKVLWIGHPRDLDTVKLEAALSGTFDVVGAKREGAAMSQRQQQVMDAQRRFWDSLHDKDPIARDAALKEFEVIYADKPEQVDAYRVRGYVAFKMYTEALALAKTYPDRAKNSKDVFTSKLRAVQDLLVANPRDADFLNNVKAMLDAIELPETDNLKGAEAMLFKLRAWLLCLQGDSEGAVKLQEVVVERMSESPLKPLEVRALEGYRNGKPPALIPRHSRDSKKPATKPATQTS